MNKAVSKVSPPEVLTIQEFIRICRQNFLLIVSIFVLALISASVYTGLFANQWYQAVALIRVERAEGDVSLFTAPSMDRVDKTFLNNQFETIQSRRILIPVIDKLNLNYRIPEMLGHEGSFDQNATYEYVERKMLELEALPNSSVIKIAVWSMDPELAQLIANEIAYQYEQDRINFATSGQTEGIAKLKEELESQAQVVSSQRDKVEKLRQDLGLAGVDIDLQASQLEVDLLRQIERTLTQLRVEAIAKKTRWEQFRAVPKEDRFALVNSELIPDPNIQNLIQAYLVQQQEFGKIQGQLGSAHPDYVAMEASLRTLKSQLDDLLDGYEKSLEINYLEAQSQVEALEKQLAGARAEQIDTAINKLRIFEETVKDLKEEETVLRSLRLAVRQREIDYQVPKRPIEILSEAQMPDSPDRPNWFINLGVAGFGGLALGLMGAYFVAFVDTSVKTVEELEQLMDIPVFGVVGKKTVLLDKDNFDSIDAEPYRVIQTNLDFLPDSNEYKTISIQSSGAGEGKSTTAFNLAVCCALNGKKTLLIDADLRRPSQHRLMEVARSPGLLECLDGKSSLPQVTRKTAIENLDFVASGEHGASSLSIIMGHKLKAQIEEIKDDYDLIFLDSPPVVGISDASVLARVVDGVLFVVQHGRNPRAMIERASLIIRQVKGILIGVILNQVPKSGGEDYSYYSYSYGQYAKDKSTGTKSKKNSDVLDFEE